MAKEKKEDRVIRETYELLYEKALPKASFTELKDNALIIDEHRKIISKANVFNENDYKGKYLKRIIYEAYYLDHDSFHNIVNDMKKKNRMGRDFDWIYLGAGPTYMPEWKNQTEADKFDKLCKKVENGEEVVLEDLPITNYEKIENPVLGGRECLLLYEYNRQSHPDVADKYLEQYRNNNIL